MTYVHDSKKTNNENLRPLVTIGKKIMCFASVVAVLISKILNDFIRIAFVRYLSIKEGQIYHIYSKVNSHRGLSTVAFS